MQNCTNSGCHANGSILEFASSQPSESLESTRHIYNQLIRSPESSHPDTLKGKYIHPGKARTSPLIWQMFGRNTSQPWDEVVVNYPLKGNLNEHSTLLSDDDKHTLVEWIDLGARFNNMEINPASSHAKNSSGAKE
jgi:hypothetical protein